MIDFSFNDKAEAAQLVAKRQAAKMITDISTQTEANIRALIVEAIREGIPPYDAANTIHDLIGLTAAQGQAALKYRKELINNGLTLANVNTAVEKYADDLLDQRAETIARTEIMDALNTGQEEAWEQAQEEGLLTAEATKEWIITPSEACPDCEEMDGETVPIGDEFEDGDPPLHPRCRCTLGIGTP